MKKDVIVGRSIRLNQQTLLMKKGEDFVDVMFVGD